MDRRTFLRAAATIAPLSALAAASLPLGCKSKATAQSELAAADLDAILALVTTKHLDALGRAMPPLAAALGDAMKTATTIEGATTKALGEAIAKAADKSDDLRNAKRSYIAIVDARGEVAFVDDAESWPFLGRKIAGAFPCVADALAGKGDRTRGAGRYGGSDESALTFVDAAPIRHGGAVVGAVVVAWEAHDAATDLQRARATTLAMQTAQPKKRVSSRERNKMILDAPEMWVLFARDGFVWFEDDVPQPLEDAARALALPQKTASGRWRGTFDVMASSWGGAAARIDALVPGESGLAIAVLRHDA